MNIDNNGLKYNTPSNYVKSQLLGNLFQLRTEYNTPSNYVKSQLQLCFVLLRKEYNTPSNYVKSQHVVHRHIEGAEI